MKGRRPFTDKTLLLKNSQTQVSLLSGESTLREQKRSIVETLSETLASVPTDAKLHTDTGATRKGTSELYLERPQGERRTVCTSSSFRSFFLHLKQICLHLTFTHEEMQSAAPSPGSLFELRSSPSYPELCQMSRTVTVTAR